MKRVALIAFLVFSISLSVTSQVGTWRTYMAYHDVQQICAADNNCLFVLASNDLYQYNQDDQSITTYDKISGLSDSYITHIAWNQQVKRLIVVYKNSNIDLIDTSGNLSNISALYLKSMTDDKTVSKITIDGIYAYLHCGFGYVKVNMRDAEITDTYRPNHPEYPTSLPDFNEYQDYETYLPIVKSLNPGGPKYNHFYEMRFSGNKLYTTGGQYTSYNDLLYPGAIQVLENNEWQIYQDDIESTTGYHYVDIDCLDFDPRDPNHVFASGRTGLYEFQNGNLIAYYNEDNSPLRSAYSNGKTLGNNYVIIKAMKFDSQGNLWLFNNHSNEVSLFKLTADKQWENLNNEAFYDDETGVGMHGVRNMMFDSKGLLWMCNEDWRSTCLICYDPWLEEVVVHKNFVNQDGTVYGINTIHCVAEDLQGNIWLGTNEGPFYIERSEVLNREAVINQVKIPRNDGTDYADYMLNGLNITYIAVDAGGRKWFGTYDNGVYLMSADNMTQLHHFLANETNLLSDEINAIAINSQTGEVFFATSEGLCSFVSDATVTSAEMTKDNVYAYPNPVTPDYTGLITVVGLSLDADVKILTASGKLVAEGRSNGGTFTWDGCDRQGRRVVSGVYMVATATSDGKKGTVCKIAIIK